MLVKSRAIALNYIRYKESSIISRMYTEGLGQHSFIVNGVRSKKSRSGMSNYQPLTLLDLVIYYNDNRDIHRISEIKCSSPLTTIPYDIIKTSVALFMGEVIARTCASSDKDPNLFEFLHNSILLLDGKESDYENEHLRFLWGLMWHLGIQPETVGEMLDQVRLSDHFRSDTVFGAQEIVEFDQMLSASADEVIKVDNMMRRRMLSALVSFYYVQLDQLGEFKSYKVLQEVLSS